MTARRPVMWSRTAFLRLALALPAPILLAACGGPASANDPREAMPQSNGTTGAPSPTPRPAATGQAPASQATGQAGAALPPTPECADEDDVTPTQTEGPYFKPRSPERASLVEPNLAGTRLVVTGRVLATDCRPVARALLDFWQADDRGVYDNAGYRLRGHQFTDEAGQYWLETVVPGLY
ncbi:MAG: hypothetical protein ACRDJN_02405, partial [Chloroflexota bacterium]